MIRRVRLALVIGILVPMTAVLLPIQIAAIRAGHPLRRRLPHVPHLSPLPFAQLGAEVG